MKFDTTKIYEMEKGTDEHMAVVEHVATGGNEERMSLMMNDLDEIIDSTPYEFIDMPTRPEGPAEALGDTLNFCERIEEQTDYKAEAELTGNHYILAHAEKYGVRVVITED